MRDFVYDMLPGRVVFGVGALDRLPDEVDKLGKRALVLSTPEQKPLAEDAARRLGARAVGVFAKAAMHVPIEVARAAREEARRLNADCYVACGGGSTIGLGKAIALETALPVIAVPTTYAGSEMTTILGITEGGQKNTLKDRRVLPKTVIYDPKLTVSLPARLSATSGMNAIAHSVEALYAENANPITSLMAEEGIAALGRSLPIVVKEPANLEARSDALYGAWLCGIALGAVGMALHHKLCHVLGGSFDLPHAETHTIVIAHAAAYNRDAAPEAMARVARALGVDDAPGGLYDLAARIGAPMKLADIGLKESDLDRAADIAVKNPYYNPRPVTREGIRALLDNAFFGRRPVRGEASHEAA
jgi:alcohol dehydrogenase class IV